MEGTGDTELADRAREGDIDAFTVLVERHRRSALRFAYGIVGDEAEDAVQDAFVKTYRNLDRFRPGSAFKPWLFTIVANEARNRRRSAARRTTLELRVRSQPEEFGAAADEESARHDQRRRLLEALDGLSDRYREVVALRFFAGLSERETAEVLSCPLGTAKSRLSRALDVLRIALGEEVTL